MSAFDTNTFKTIKKISEPKERILISRPGNQAGCWCAMATRIISVIDPEKEAPVGKVDLGGPAEAAVVNKGTGYVNIEETDEVAVFDRDLDAQAKMDRSPATRRRPPRD